MNDPDRPDEVIPPDLQSVLQDLKLDIMASINCVQIGKIEKINLSAQTIEASIQVRRKSRDGSSDPYPVLVDCPFVVIQGGGAYIDIPIAVGDYCILFFNDRDIDNWWSAAIVSDPNSTRKHSFSDAMALVGINPKTKVLSLDGTDLRIMASGKKIKATASAIELNGNSKAFVTYTELNTALQGLITALNTALSTKLDGGGAPGTLTLNISSAQTTTVKTGG